MTATIVGAQLGDEGKGGIVDLLGEAADVVVRYQGGDNAGHTVVAGDEEYKLSLVPSGSVRGRAGVLGNGCVINPRTLFEELDTLADRGLDAEVKLAERAHVICPSHRRLDGIEEEAKDEADTAVGTTGRGIGPAYEDKAGRRGVRVADLLDPASLRDRLEYLLEHHRRVARDVYGVEPSEAFNLDAVYEEYREYGRRLAEENMTVDAAGYLAERRAAGDTILLEGAQGTLLDIDHGGYPFVTSSNPTAGYAATGSGLPPSVVGGGAVVGVVKAYLSRVGAGPMPTQLDGDRADTIRERGGEYGTVTGRPRRVGWLDLPMLRHATRVSGFSDLALNHLDVLASLEELRVAVSYERDGQRLESLPPTADRWAQVEPVYREFDTWEDTDWRAIAEEGYQALPSAAQTYVEFLEEELDVPVSLVGVGPSRAETVVRTHPLDDRED